MIAEIRAQAKDQEKSFRVALEESEAANQVLCNSVEERNRQL